jgi:signal transduction histidine kinase
VLVLVLWPPARLRFRVAPLLFQAVCGLAMVWFSASGTTAATLVIVAAELPYFVPARAAQAWVMAQSVALAIMFGRLGGWNAALAGGGAMAGFQLFALASSSLALSERRARDSLAIANAELRETRAQLAESSRAAERLRIARDLHDTMGHHLTALSLQLDVAARLADPSTAERVREAHAITRLLLGDVRDVVSRMREGWSAPLAESLRTLAANAAPLQVHLDLAGELRDDEAVRAHAIHGAVQEIITNARRHASAANLWLRVEEGPDGVRLHARDDGRGAEALRWGHGLTGMRERFEEQGGRLEVHTAAGAGFTLDGVLPRRDAG